MSGTRSRQQFAEIAGGSLPLGFFANLAAHDVVRAADVLKSASVNNLDLKLVFLDDVGSSYLPPDSALSEAEQLLYEVITCSDHDLVDHAFGELLLLSLTTESLSAFASQLLREEPPASNLPVTNIRPESWLRSWGYMETIHQEFNQLRRDFIEQRSQALWPEIAGTWRKLSPIFREIACAQEEGRRLHTTSLERKLEKGNPPDWMVQPLPVGPIVRKGNTLRLRLDKFLAGGVVGLCRRLVNIIKTGCKTFPVSASEKDQMMRYDRLLSMSDRMCLQLSQDESSAISLSEVQRKFDKLVRAKREFLERLTRALQIHSDHDPQTSGQIAPSSPLPAETPKLQEAAKPETKPASTKESSRKEFKVIIRSLDNVQVNGKTMPTAARMALLGLAILDTHQPELGIQFSSSELLSLIRLPAPNSSVSQMWQPYHDALRKFLSTDNFDEGHGTYTIFGLRFELRLPLEELAKRLRARVSKSKVTKPGDTPSSPA